MTEAQFLQKQQELAKEAIARTWAEVSSGLAEGGNPLEWTRQYPWVAMGAAAVAGFAATTALVPSKREKALRQLAELQRALHPEWTMAAASDKPQDKRGLLATLMVDALKTLQPVLVSAITAKLAKSDAHNGREHPPAGMPGNPPPSL